MIIIGWRLFGKIKQNKDGSYIATRFFHICFFPIGPIDSHFIIKPGIFKFEGIPIDLDILSVIIAYIRAIFILATLGTLLLAYAKLWPAMDMGLFSSEESIYFWLSVIAFIFCIYVLAWSYFSKMVKADA